MDLTDHAGIISPEMIDAMKEHPFLEPAEEKGYRLFPADLENDELVAFHGTARANLKSIFDNGFRFTADLQSLSFAKNSPLALRYACCARSNSSPEGCVLVVRFASLNEAGIANETSIIHVYALSQLPVIIGYCIVPADYNFW
jgi:hypothetical protein